MTEDLRSLSPAPRKPRVAVVDDDPATRKMMHHWLARAGFETIEIESGSRFLGGDLGGYAAVCLDLGLDDMHGVHVLQHARATDPELPIIVVTADKGVDTAVEAMRAGAYDYVTKPIDPGRLLLAVQRATERRELSNRVRKLSLELEVKVGLAAILGKSAAVRELKRQIERVLGSDVAVCVFGESGTGKELVARAVHENGTRRGGPLVAINCAAVPTALQESELFGHEKGAFTGANTARKGRFELANGGTLFLDELGEMSASTQAALLRALEQRTILRVGGTEEVPVDVRVVSATHRDLEAEVRAGRFREDLYFRLVVYPIHVPPLRERLEDVPLLAEHFLRKLAREAGREPPRVTAEALDALLAHRWPGNVRELSNVMHRALLASDGDRIQLADLPPAIQKSALPAVPPPSRGEPAPKPSIPREEEEPLTLREIERRAIERAMKFAGGSVTKAAKILGVARATLYRRLAEIGYTAGTD